MEDVFQGLHKLTRYPVDQMIAAEVFKNHFQRIFDSTESIDSFTDDRDRLYVYVNWSLVLTTLAFLFNSS